MDDPVWVRRARGFLDFFSTLNLSILLNHRCWKGSKEEKRKLDKGHLKVIRDKFWEIRLLVRWKKRFQVSVHSCNTDGDAVKQQVDVEILLEVMLMLRSWCRGGRSRHQLSVFPLWLFRLQLNPETFSMHSLFSWDTSALIWCRRRLCGKAAIRKHFMLNSKQIFRKLIHQKWNQLHAERQPSFFPSSSSLRLSEGCRPSERLASSPQTTTVFICPPASWFICRPPAPPATAAPPL